MYILSRKNSPLTARSKNLWYNRNKNLQEFSAMGGTAKKTKSGNNRSFGRRLAQIRKAKGLTQTELGSRIGVSQRIMHHYENKAEYPPAQKIIDLARALDMSVDELLGVDKGSFDSYKNINPKLAKRLRLASNLPSHELKALSTFIDALLLKQKVRAKAAGPQGL
jgi:transcriptional regulator with XRE-family HTH domain